jgi:hypothetical protein
MKGHHFIPMAMEVHNAPKHDMDHFIKEYPRPFHDWWSKYYLTYVIERKIVLAGDACSRPPIIITFHDLHVGDNRGTMGEIVSYLERD